MSWMTWILFVSLLWIYSVCISDAEKCPQKYKKLKCVKQQKTSLVIGDDFRGFFNGGRNQTGMGCIVFLRKNQTEQQGLKWGWPQMMAKDGSYLLLISQWHIKNKLQLHVLEGKHCNSTSCNGTDSACVFNHTLTDSCQIRCVDTGTICNGYSYSDKICSEMGVKDSYIINITATNNNCINCNDPVKKPEQKITCNATIITEGEKVDATKASEVMNSMPNLVANIKTSAEVTVGKGLKGVIVTQRDPEEVDQVLFAYESLHDSISIIDSEDALATFQRSVVVPKEAFEKIQSQNVSVPFAVIFRFNNLTDESNSTILNDEVLAVSMATEITNLTDKIRLNFHNVIYDGTPSCQSWNGEGSRPNWTGDGCETITHGNNVTCACSHLTFFAILLAPPNVTISSSDLRKLTIITQIGCGVSMFFLGIVLFMHFLLRRTKASIATRILIHLVSALFLLNLTFLTNNYVAQLKSSVGCKIMAALMHYFMLATFTWFAVQAFHICQQLYMGGKTIIRHYMIKVCITSWVLPSIVGIVLLSIGKYGEQAILTSDSTESISMCWITDTEVHSIVNIGYYALVFIFTFITFITIVSWLCCLRRVGAGTETSGKNIVIILGLCCMLGITWGFAFFAHGILRIPAYYIFTVLNSFQGLFLFIYYWKTSHSKEVMGGVSDTNSSSNTSTLKTRVDIFENPYSNLPEKEKKPGNTGGE
ncbi:adhesion G protein-coupled receptor G3-like isoform X3 [Epinephelus lanceolatus]